MSTRPSPVVGHQAPQAAADGVVNSSTLQQAPRRQVQRDPHIHRFERRLSSAKWWACAIAALYALSRFVAYCNLTSAIGVLLGAYAAQLALHDVKLVLGLLLVEGARLASASFFMRLLTRPLAYQSQSPTELDHSKDKQYLCSLLVRTFSYLVQLGLIIPSLVLPFFSHRLPLGVPHGHIKDSNLQITLRIFYSLVLGNSVVGILILILSAGAFCAFYKPSSPNEPRQESVLRYFDTVLQNARSSGLVLADDFEFFHFAYTMLGGEFRRNVQPEAVAKNHKDLIRYLYLHRIGVDFLHAYMDAADAFVQLAAVNMVGFWADRTWGVGFEEVKLPKHVLMKLVDKVQRTGQVGWAATTSVGVLASSTPQLAKELAQMRTARTNHSVLECLADMIDPSSRRSLAIVRALVRLYEQLCTDEQGPPTLFTDAQHTDLVQNLHNLAKHAEVQRLRVQAAYLLLLMQERCSSTIIKTINPKLDAYWFRSEKEMLELLVMGYTEHVKKLDYPKIHEDRSINPPDWAKKSWDHASAGSNPTSQEGSADSQHDTPASSNFPSTSSQV